MRTGPTAIATALRRRYERVQGLAVEAQIRDVVDYLENPEVLVAEFVDAYCAIESCADADELILESRSPQRRDPLAERFVAGSVVEIEGADAPALRCIGGPAPLLADREDAERRGLDYVGLVPGVENAPVIGVIESLPGSTPFSLLMRALACLTEIAPAAHLERVNEHLFKGGLVPGSLFELQLVMQRSPVTEAERTLAQLTRDLAETFRQALVDEWQFPDLLRRISCLRAEPGARRLSVDWIA